MFLYTIIPDTIINSTENSEKFKSICFNDSIVQLRSFEGKYKVERILSTNPRDYLNSEIQLGGELKNYRG